jgi:hypothetical protein
LVSPSGKLYPEPQSELTEQSRVKSPSWDDEKTPSDSGIPLIKELSHQLSQQLGFQPPPKSKLLTR